MTVETFTDEQKPEEAAAIDAILEMLDDKPLQFGIDVLLTSFSKIIGQTLAENTPAEIDLEPVIERSLVEYSAMIKLTILNEVAGMRGKQ